MRWGTLILVVSAATLAGCSSSMHTQAKPPKPVVVPEPLYEPSHASALAFSPPIAQNEPAVDLSRADREPTAFVGYEDLITSYIYVRTDDQWNGNGCDNYQRRAIIDKVGTTTR